MKKQKGVVLFFALIVLIIMTVIGVALAVNSTQSLRMAGAGSERIEAKALADGAIDRVLLNNSAAELAKLAEKDDSTFLDGNQTLTPLPLDSDGNPDAKDVSCQRSSKASGTDLFKCRRLEISSSVNFGRENLGRLTVVTGIEQEVLNGSGS
ncbi:pilus assembly PilX N-terminal domain-containing protein [Shewanella sp. A25]|nr:pilus assembly PilX N-terminal domain-containing protein [Shewanella shenzhenensis]